MKKTFTKRSEIIILECSYCFHDREWDKTLHPEGVGYCSCRRAQFLRSINKNQFFRVRKERRPKGGHVIVMSDKGRQRLSGPYYREDPNKWEPYPNGE